MRGLSGANKLLKNLELSFDTFSFKRNTNDKFSNDKIFLDTTDIILGFDGVVLNKKELMSLNGIAEWQDFFLNAKKPEDFVNDIKGIFHGFIFYKKERVLYLFNDPYGLKNFSIYNLKNTFIFSYDDISLIDILKENGYELEINTPALYSFISYGFLTSKISWVHNGFRMEPGSILKFHNGNISTRSYIKFISNPNTGINKEKASSQLEELFKNAVKLQFDKDKEYNYTHFTTLSGGLDSRVTTLMAYENKYTDLHSFTCSQSGYDDELIAREIANEYKIPNYFYPLDDFNHLFDIPSVNEKIGGTAIYSGPAHVIFGIEKFWKNDY
ncbi:MAG: asparagine synthase-related protein, partial [Saprospiraceae bacterium]